MLKIWLFIFSIIFTNFSTICCRGIDGGLSCAVCTVATGVIMQVAELHTTDFLKIAEGFCLILPISVRDRCTQTFNKLKPYATEISEIVTPDMFCYTFGKCEIGNVSEICHLFPMKQKYMEILKRQSSTIQYPKIDFCEIPFFEEICNIFTNALITLDPVVDFDDDGFSNFPIIRGSDWRGKDCLDNDPTVYPGRRPIESDINMDSNCNGIWGKSPFNNKPWEDILCASSEPRGLIYVGDSIGAHFHMPEVWINPLKFHLANLYNVSYVLLDELDWPQHGFATGFKNITRNELINGTIDSLYLRLRARNRCNHRDYQNLSQNGASSFEGPGHVRSVRRNKTNDYPAIVIFAMQGNDVCNNTAYNRTKPAEFRQNVLETLQIFDEILPRNSHVVLVGLVDGYFIYETMNHRIHPIGEPHKNVYYNDMYEWFNCLEIGPCAGWLNSNKTIRSITSQKSEQLTTILKNLVKNKTFKNFKLHFIKNPINKIIDERKNINIEHLLEPVDGFHPNQFAQPLLAKAVWELLLELPPEVLGHVNPYNSMIDEIFGDQGGH